VKYTPAGSVDISISRNTKDRKIIFSIKDTGVGISPEVMPKLFTKFVRAENANKQNIYGTGLGLYVAKEIVTAHKGRIWAESQGEGRGSTFFLELDMEV
jgi:signal transduction histidine kinase